MNKITICIWTGNNFAEILTKISEFNTETMIRVIGKRIIIKDNHVDFYQSVVIGDMVEIPIYPECLICDECNEEPEYMQPKYDNDHSNKLLKEWGIV